MKTLYPQQHVSKDVLIRALALHKAALDSSDTGTGKTVKAVELIRELGANALIVCPKAVRDTWLDTAEEQGVRLAGVINYEKLKTGNSPFGRWRTKSEFLFPPEINTIVWDEVHKCKSAFTQNSKMLVSAKGLYNIMLSATPCSDPTEMRALGYVLGLHSLTNFYKWCFSLGCQRGSFNKIILPPDQVEKTLSRLNDQIYTQGRGHKLSRLEMPEFFKECSIQHDPLDFGDADQISALYEEMGPEVEALTERMANDKSGGVDELVRILRLRQKVELLKVPLMVEMAQELVAEGNNVVIFTNFTESARAVVTKLQALGCKAESFLGSDPDTYRRQSVYDFQHNLINVLVVNISAGGSGLNLHDLRGRPRVSLVNLSFNAVDVIQALGRIDRSNSLSPSLQKLLVARGTIETRIAQIITEKKKKFDLLHSTVTLQPTQPTTDMPEIQLELPVVNEVPHGRPAHHPRGPSKRKYFEVCPSYTPNDGEAGEAALKGTRIHQALELGNLNLLDSEEERFLAEQIIKAENGVFEYFNMAKGHYEDYKEVELDCDFGEGYSNYGTVDRFRIKDSTGVLVDYKTGFMAVDDAEINAQVDNYVLGAFQKWKHVDTIHAVLLLPARDEMSFHTFTRAKDYVRIQLRHRTIDKRADAKVEENPVVEVCEFCSRIAECGAWRRFGLKVYNKYADDTLELPEGSIHGTDINDPDVLGPLLKIARVMDKWSEGLSKKGIEMAHMGQTPTGFRAQAFASAREIAGASVPAVIEAVAPLGITDDEVYACVKGVAIGKLEELVESRAARGKKKEMKLLLEHTLRDKNLLLGGTETFIRLVVDRSA
jgi:hypothetical protein